MDAQEERILIAIVGTTLVLGSVMVTLIYLLLRQHRRNLRLEREARRIEFNALEKERMRLAADLHDELSPMLTAVKLGINNIEPCRPEDAERLRNAHIHISGLSKKMREVSFDLMPEVLVRKGLPEAVRAFIGYITRNHPLQIRLSLPGDEQLAVPDLTAIQVYRIVQEIVHNTIRHAGATEMQLSISVDEGTLLIRAGDNGLGFDRKVQEQEGGGLGLKTIQGRVDLLGGELVLNSRPGSGTVYKIEIPSVQP